MKPLPDKSKIENGIVQFFRTNINKEFHANEMRSFILKTQQLQRTPYHDTILRYMRLLAQNGDITYQQIGEKSKSLYRIIDFKKEKMQKVRCGNCGNKQDKFTLVTCKNCGQLYDLTAEILPCPKCGESKNIAICEKCHHVLRDENNILMTNQYFN